MWAVTFRQRRGHVHYCPDCLSEAMGRFRLERARQLPCPYTHAEVFTADPPEIGESA